ncbi:STAS domain-containing protein [Streptomyces kunmingensis]|uniref:STAS domain-containing protein n=1 Tax=Streptomyces kunmingensis TaxID=68225 RepID=A0ABU6C7I2_9ACTN|nr:STAS domain-containing protein [Streptomyces kunmingensis]MEB3960667.1 STAS domain-containing protein [Streptomyces kunmingensis]
MTTYAALNLAVAEARDGALTLQVVGALDYDTSGHFTAYTSRALADHPGLRVLRLDCAGLSGVDSMGLSTLLGLRRRLDAAGASLHIAERSPRLNRLLTITGTFEYLVGADEAAEAEQESSGAESGAGPGHGSEADSGPGDPRRTRRPQERR